MPAQLLDALYLLDDLADEAGHDRLLDECRRNGVRTDQIGKNLTPAELAIRILLTHPQIVCRCHAKTTYQKIRNFEEFQAREKKVLSLNTAKKKTADLESSLSSWFDSRARSAVCEIDVYEERKELSFLITHGRPYFTQGSIDKAQRKSRVAYRPQKHDKLVYCNRTGVLKINAHSAAEKEQYRRVFGEVLFGSPFFFPESHLYILDLLASPNPKIRLTPGISSARLTEVTISVHDDQRFTQTSRGFDLLECVECTGRPNLQEGNITRACFSISYTDKGKARRLEVRPPNVAIYDRDRDGQAAEEFLKANGFFLGGMSDAKRAQLSLVLDCPRTELSAQWNRA